MAPRNESTASLGASQGTQREVKVLVAYYTGGWVPVMAGLIGEGIRFAGGVVVIYHGQELKHFGNLDSYDGFIVGSSTYKNDLPDHVREELRSSHFSGTANKLAGSFSCVGSGRAGWMILDILETQYKMRFFPHGPLVVHPSFSLEADDRSLCQNYGKAFVRLLQAEEN